MGFPERSEHARDPEAAQALPVQGPVYIARVFLVFSVTQCPYAVNRGAPWDDILGVLRPDGDWDLSAALSGRELPSWLIRGWESCPLLATSQYYVPADAAMQCPLHTLRHLEEPGERRFAGFR